MKPNPLADREKALEDQWIREKEKQMAKEQAAKKQEAAKDVGSADKAQQEAGKEQK